MTRPAFAAELRAAGHPAAFARYLPPVGPTAATFASVTHDGTDRRTDGRTDARQMHRPRCAYYAISVDDVIRRFLNVAGKQLRGCVSRRRNPVCISSE